jgi:hypothetical protein
MPPQQEIPPELRGRPFRLSEALAAGLSVSMLRGQRFQQLRRGVYAEATVADDLEMRVDAARLTLPDGTVFSHATAAQLRGLPVPPTSQIHVTLPPDVERTRAAGVRPHRRTVRSELFRGRLISAPTDNFLELAEMLSLVDLVVLGDAMVRRRLVSCASLLHGVAASGRRRGLRVARRAASLVRAGVDSPRETHVRLLIVLAGLPEPELNFVVRDAFGGWIGAVDLAYPALRIAIEYHGDIHRTKRGRWRSDIAKAELLREAGWTVIILTATDIYDRPERTLERLHATLVKAGHPAVPAALTPEWRKHLMPEWARDRVEWSHTRAS